jgi:orotate phosphoribosyltransferase
MEQYKQEFITFMIESGVLKFGSFTLKSGRHSPFFMNAGAFVTGTQLRKLGMYYAQAIHTHFGDDFDVLFGPAYKGIPLSTATVIAYDMLYGKQIRYCSNRKEIKDHGDTGILLGSSIHDGDRIIIIEDVTTSGKSIEETYPILTAQGSTPGAVSVKGLIVSLNRMERGLESDQSALDEIQTRYGFPACAIVTMQDVIDVLYTNGDKTVITSELKKEIDLYYQEWGAKNGGIQ